MGYLDLAISDFTEALHLDNGLAKAYYNRGYAYSEQGDFVKAVKDFEKADSLSYHEEALFWFRWGQTLSKVVNFTEAIQKLSIAISHDSNFAMAYASRGYAYLQLGKKYHREARNDFHRALSKFTDRDSALLIEVHTSLGRMEARENNYLEAIHHYQKALNINQNYYLARYHLAKIYKDSNQVEAAVTEFKHVVQTAPPNSAEAEQARKWIACLETNHKSAVINQESI
jgi:tetratricopeptide (TPR) repeat protein